MRISSAMVKICGVADCLEMDGGVCLSNQGFQFQIVLDGSALTDELVKVSGSLTDYATVYRVYDKKGNYDYKVCNKTDDYYIRTEDDTYPDLLQRVSALTVEKGEKCVLLVDISEREKPSGVHTVTVEIGGQACTLTLEVFAEKLAETDMIVTHWFHMDAICNYYGVEPFSNEFYERFTWFLEKYVQMGNNMILLPAFTPPLDTEVGGERLTTQLVKAKKDQDGYAFDFSEMKRFIALCQEKGIKYFEHSHLFTQWGGKFCPKIIVEEKGEKRNAFGWEVASDDERYKEFLTAYLTALQAFLREQGVWEKTYLHLTDEPHGEHVEKYKELSDFVKGLTKGMKVMDAISEKEVAAAMDIPVVVLNAKDLDLFDEHKMLYYCVGVDGQGITNRYFYMPLQRTEILGMQLYENRAKGFLHWGYNFYNTQFSKAVLNPYEDATAGGGFPAGDSFIVYPGESEAEPSVRYFSLKRAFEDYRLLKTLEKTLGKDAVISLLHQEGVKGVHEYPRSARWQEEFRAKLVRLVAKR